MKATLLRHGRAFGDQEIITGRSQPTCFLVTSRTLLLACSPFLYCGLFHQPRTLMQSLPCNLLIASASLNIECSSVGALYRQALSCVEIKQEVGITNTDITAELKVSKQRGQHHWKKEAAQQSVPIAMFSIHFHHTPSKTGPFGDTALCTLFLLS